MQQARAELGTVVIDFRVEQEDSVFPMVPAGADLHAMIRRPTPVSVLVETAAEIGKLTRMYYAIHIVALVEDKPGVLIASPRCFAAAHSTSSR